MTHVTIGFSAFDRQNQRHLYFKQDGKRFSAERTVKICTDVKYDITVTVKPSSLPPLRNLVIGGDDISHDSTEEKENHMEYHYTWFTNGYTSTKSGQRLDLAVVFLFEGAELRTKFQAKFYPVVKGNHLTWGTPINRIELEGKGNFGTGSTGATGFQLLSLTEISFY